jgi:3-oxoisoapionate decarboxylase
MPRAPLGLASTCYMTVRRLSDAVQLLEHADALGASGAQAALAPGQGAAVRALCERTGLYFESMATLPREGDTARFEGALREAREAGARCVRVVCLSGRRYETFRSLGQWNDFAAESRRRIALALPLAERARVPLALENHKDWTLDELTALLREFDSEYLGVCLDTGNNLALLDDSPAFVNALASYAVSTHIKDMALSASDDGFLLSEVPLGTGQLDIPCIAARIRESRPNTPFTLEMITRDPLRIPCLTSHYWATIQHCRARKLAAILDLARDNRTPLPRLDGLPEPTRLAREEENVKACLDWAAQHLA